MRNTYDSKNPYNKPLTNANQESKERETYTAGNPKLMSFQKQGQSKTSQSIEKMTKNILDTMKRLSVSDPRLVGSPILKPNSKTLVGVISVLLNSFDNMFEENSLNPEMLPQLFKSLGYPSNISKTYFMPVGAPHTWSQCLMMMDWLCQLAIFHIQIRSHLEQGDFGEDFTSLLIRAYLQNNLEIPKLHLEQSIVKKGQLVQDSKYHTNTHTLEIENIKASQKEINIIQDEKKRLQSILNRQTQQVIQIHQQNFQMQRRLKELQEKIEHERGVSNIHSNQITSLTNQIENQQLSVEQVEKIRFQIKEYHEKLTQLRRFYEIQKQNLDKIDSNIIDEYVDFNKTLQVVRLMHKKHRYEMQRRNVYLTIPECEIGAFTQFVKARKQELSELKTEQLLGIKEIKEIKEKAQLLLTIVETQIRNLQDQRERIHSQNRTLNEQWLQKTYRTNELEGQYESQRQKLQTVKSKITQIQYVNVQLASQTSKIQEEIRQALIEQQNLIIQTDQISKESMQLGKIKISLQNQVNESIAKMEQRFNDYQFQFLELLENDCEYFEQSVEQQYEQIEGETDFCVCEREKDGMDNNQMMAYAYDENGNVLTKKNSGGNTYNSNNRGVFDSPPSQRINRLNDYGRK